jgi:hypothetical protein
MGMALVLLLQELFDAIYIIKTKITKRDISYLKLVERIICISSILRFGFGIADKGTPCCELQHNKNKNYEKSKFLSETC